MIELLVVLVIVSFLVAMAAMVTRVITSQQRRSTTATRMVNVDAALIQFVLVQRRLPCPADGSVASSNANAGIEGARDAVTGCTTNQQNGVVPWRVLGLADADATDGWDRRFTFRIPANLAIDAILDMTQCDPAGGGMAEPNGSCKAGCTSATLLTCTTPTNYLTGKGLTIQNVAGTVVMAAPSTGAAYVVVSHGETGGGAMLPSGLVYASTTVDSAPEQMNYANLPLQPNYVDDSVADAPGGSHFDDLVSRPTILGVVSKAGLGPRPHP